jgi:hypothetical protein
MLTRQTFQGLQLTGDWQTDGERLLRVLKDYFDGLNKKNALQIDVAAGIDTTPIGASAPDTGAFTTLSASDQITSTVVTGTAPLIVASTTKIANLNADLLDGMDSTPLTPYTPVITPSSGSITTQTGTGYYQTLGNFVWFTAQVVINAAGTAAGANATFISLPSTPLGSIIQICVGRETTATGTLLQAVMQNSNSTAAIQTYSNGAHAIQTGYKFVFTGIYRT